MSAILELLALATQRGEPFLMASNRSSPKSSVGKFRFKKHDSIGVSDAEQDQNFLHDCFVDTGDLEVLRDTTSPRRIVLGRTGSGKTALLMQFQREETDHVINVKPESLALNYISNSNILNFVLQLGVSLDIFFRLLWRHVFVVEVLKAHFKIHDEKDSISLVEKIKNMFRDNKHDRAIEYLRTWGKSFWEDTDYRIREVTTKVESDLQASLGGMIPAARISIGGAQKVSEEERQEIIPRAQEVINKVQIKELSDIIELLGAVLEQRRARYYIIIDRLDENWVSERLRYLLIRALIETVRDFRKAPHVKIIIALRYDLIDRVFRETRDAGFQEEKYEGLYLNLSWNKNQLTKILDKRIHHLVRQTYTSQVVTHQDLMPSSIMKVPTVDYMIERTLMRPRDIIEFFNFCILQAADTPKISSQMIKQAEGEYSRTRLRSIAEEWYADYPNIFTFADLLKNSKAQFPIADVRLDECADFCLNLLIGGVQRQDALFEVAEKFVETEVDFIAFKQRVFQLFYRFGLVGLKLATYETTAWTFDGRRNIAVSEIHDDTKVSIHPCFYRILGTQKH
jgi:hypothetical protein